MRGTTALILVLMLSLAGCTQTEWRDDSKTGPSQPADVSSAKSEPDKKHPAPPLVAQEDKQQEEEQQPAPSPVTQAHKEQQTSPEPAVENPEDMRSIDELLLFFPIKFPAGDWEPRNLKYEDVWFNAKDGTKLHGWYCPCDKPRAVVLFAHGNAGNLSHRAWLASYLQQQLRVSVMMFDYRGYGRSEGTPTAEGILQDGRAASEALAEKAGVKESDLVLMGRSLGGAVVVPLAVEIEARGLILQSTFSSMKDVADFLNPTLSWLVPPDKLNSAAKIGEFHGALLQSHGDADRTVPYSSGEKLFAAANEPKQFVTIIGGDHNDAQSEEYYETLEEFIAGLAKE